MSRSEKAQERIRLIEERLARLRSEKERLEARVSQAERKRMTRRKIVIGGTVLAALGHEGVPPMRTEAELKRWLEARLTRSRRVRSRRPEVRLNPSGPSEISTTDFANGLIVARPLRPAARSAQRLAVSSGHRRRTLAFLRNAWRAPPVAA
jgi:hypothetical protein